MPEPFVRRKPNCQCPDCGLTYTVSGPDGFLDGKIHSRPCGLCEDRRIAESQARDDAAYRAAHPSLPTWRDMDPDELRRAVLLDDVSVPPDVAARLRYLRALRMAPPEPAKNEDAA